MNQRPDVRLLLDEMFSPAIAAGLRERGYDVIAVADPPDLRAKSDEEIFAWATADRRWLLTENVKDFRPIMLRALLISAERGDLQYQFIEVTEDEANQIVARIRAEVTGPSNS